MEWYQALAAWLAASGTSDVLGFVGFVVTIVGFVATLWNVARSRRAAEAARDAADEVRRRISTFETVRVLASAVAQLRAVQTDQRSGRWDTLPGRYGEIRGALIGVRERTPTLSEDQRTVIQTAILVLARIEHELDRALAAGKAWENMARSNKILSEQADGLLTILHELERAAVGEHDGQ
jgi:hypothetical protein